MTHDPYVSNPTASSDVGPYDALKVAIHQRLLDAIDLTKANRLEETALVQECTHRVNGMLESVEVEVPEPVRREILKEILDEVFGLGPIEPLMDDPEITDIMVNGADMIFIEKAGKIERLPIRFRDNQHLLNVIQKIVRHAGRRLDESSPMVDARLPDGSRVNAVIHPVALDGPSLSIRRFRNQGFTLAQLTERGMLAPEMAGVLQRCVESRLNIIISGGSGAGKTTLLNAMSDGISPRERVVTIEDTAELKLRQDHVVRLETKPANVEGAGEITTRDAVRNALRMRPDRILVGECRGAEAFDMLQAMNSGHSGSMTTMHANGPVDAFRRLESMLCMAGMEVPVSVMREYVGSAINLVIQVERLGSGDRRIVSIAEVRPIEGGAAQIEDIFRFQLSGTDGRSGYFEATGCRPHCVDRLKSIGIDFDDSLFTARRLMEITPRSARQEN